MSKECKKLYISNNLLELVLVSQEVSNNLYDMFKIAYDFASMIINSDICSSDEIAKYNSIKNESIELRKYISELC